MFIFDSWCRTIQNEAPAEMQGLCCFWNINFYPPTPPCRSEPARDEAIKPTANLPTKTLVYPTQDTWNKPTSTKQHLLPMILTHNGNRSPRLP